MTGIFAKRAVCTLLAALMLSGTALADVSKPATKGGVRRSEWTTDMYSSSRKVHWK